MLRLKQIDILPNKAALEKLPEGKLLINTINAHSYNTAQKNEVFAEALTKGGVLIPDGASIVKACRWLKAKSRPTERVAGWDLFEFEMNRLNNKAAKLKKQTCEAKDANDIQEENATGKKARVMFMGSSEKVLGLIRERAAKDFPQLEIVTYSPPYKPEFSEEENLSIISAINNAKPDLLWIGMTAPKQEKWAYSHWQELDIHCHCGTIGAVFDFYAGTVKRAPIWWQKHSLEWMYRLIKEPRRMWKRYLIGNVKFFWNIAKE